MPDERETKVIDLQAYRAQRAERIAMQQPSEPLGLEFENVDDWLDHIRLLYNPTTLEYGVRLGPDVMLSLESARKVAITILWNLMHAHCEACLTGGEWCQAHRTDEALFRQIEERVDAAIALKL